MHHGENDKQVPMYLPYEQFAPLSTSNIESEAERNITYFVGTDGKKKAHKEKPKCTRCNKMLKYEQNYI